VKEEILNLIGKVQNPVTNKEIREEGRVLEIIASEEGVKIKYNREGISPKEKRSLEDDIIESLKTKYSPEQITLLSVSKDSADVFQAHGVKAEEASSAKPAGISVGHGSISEKPKKIGSVKKIIAVSSGKGGVGKSTVAVNLASSLHNLGKKVGILDADVYGPSVPMLLGKRDARPIANENQKIVPIESNGIKFMSFGFFIGESEPVIWRGPMLNGVLTQFLFDVEWGELDYLVLDLPPGTGDMQLSMAQNLEIDGALVVSTPQNVALLDTKKGLEMFNKLNVPVMGMVENMSYFVSDESETKHYIFGKGGVKEAAKELKTEYFGEIPLEVALREASDEGTPYMAHKEYEGRPVWNAYMELAMKIDKQMEKKKGFLSKILS